MYTMYFVIIVLDLIYMYTMYYALLTGCSDDKHGVFFSSSVGLFTISMTQKQDIRYNHWSKVSIVNVQGKQIINKTFILWTSSIDIY